MRLPAIVTALLAVSLLSACGENSPMVVSEEQEVAIGQETAAQVVQEYGQPVRYGPEVERVERVGRPLLQHVQRRVPYSISVLDNSEVINAFAVPGGPTFVTRALVNTMSADDELAFVLAHELAHIENEHGREAINQALLVNTAAQVLLGDRGQLIQLGAQVAWALYSQGYTRAQERESDATGVRLMAAANFDPRGALRSLAKLGGGELTGPARWLSSHPSTPERIRLLQEQIQREYNL
ncbi:MAG: M48 family metalloprotease [Armatimonadetes bacterium]|nr:M48 family metalloprotease [Armatimonadota bacterium]